MAQFESNYRAPDIPNHPMIALDDIQFSYPGTTGTPMLAIESWRVAPGRRVFLHGPSGSGKSTFLNLLSGLLVPQVGRVQLNGICVNELKRFRRDHFRAHNIGVIFQRFNLIPWLTVGENIEVAYHFANKKNCKLSNSSVHELLKWLGLEPSVVNRKTSELSVGQQQRVAIGRALINEPDIIIADEPTSSLDAYACKEFMTVLFRVVKKNNSTLVFVSHDMRLAEYFDDEVNLLNLNAAGRKSKNDI